MRFRRTLGGASRQELSVSVLLIALCGCAMVPPNSFIDPTKVGRFGLEAQEGGIRRILSPRETPPGLANAVEPTPEDLVAQYTDYRIGPGDVLTLTIQDLIESGRPYAVGLEVSPLGEIRIPDLGSVKVTGLTEQEVEQEVSARLKESGILPRPVVIVYVQQKRGRIFNIVGAVRAAGPYPISDPDLRLLEALGMAGDADANSRRLYVIRRESGRPGVVPSGAAPAATTPPAPIGEGLVIPPPVEDEPKPPPGMLSSVGGGRPEDDTNQAPPTKEELADLMAVPSTQSRPATRAAAPGTESGFPPIIFDPQTGQVLETERRTARKEAPRPETPPAAPPQKESFEKPFDWNEVEEIGLEQRVIGIDLNELKAGNARYNIVIRDRDVINVPTDTGVFYAMGEINRPGVYGFGGRDITIKQALAICGGFTQMAWPQRCDLIRREPGTDKQVTRTVNLDAIFAGLEDDFYLRDDDILNVGTHFVAPFLFVIRNSFRFTYGFGFVYDRNFADQDAINAKANPETVRQAKRATRGLPY